MMVAESTTGETAMRGQALQGGGRDADAILDSIRRRIAALHLDLSGLTVVTEAATGAYAATAVIAAMAGAKQVHAVARDTVRHGTFEDAASATLSLAERAGVDGRIALCREASARVLASCDILTNSGHLRPITREMIERLSPTAVIALMFEAWEFRETDLDSVACRERGVRIAAVNERHPDVGVFHFLGPLCVRLLADAGIRAEGCRVAVLCDNPFAPFLEGGLTEAGAVPDVVDRVAALRAGDWGAVVIALDPARNPAFGDAEFAWIARVAPSARIVQFWGDLDRAAAERQGFAAIWPPTEPRPGHMGILLNALGHEPIVRLQAGGLRAAELVFRGAELKRDGVAQLVGGNP